MPRINLLPREISELIAAGEVVERPASVIKELVENSIDAGAKRITVEISNGGISYMRVTDDGCGIYSDDVKTAFLRHATSKIKSADDLDAIATLGFRGEALAATGMVSKVELFTKTADEEFGTHYQMDGGVETLNEPSGCPVGTTLVVRDLFYNTPARMKFLKKDVSEGTAVSAVVERAALSHPEISFKFIRDGKQVLQSAGDGLLKNAIYSILGREFANGLIDVCGAVSGIEARGYICKPVYCKGSRNSQYLFLNGRLVRSGTVTAAVEQAYKNSMMVGKFPSFVLFVNAPFETVDVNVHPAKTEVRFADEKRIFDAVYISVKAALEKGDDRPNLEIGKPQKKAEFFTSMSAEQYRQQSVNFGGKNKPQPDLKETIAEKIYNSLPNIPHKECENKGKLSFSDFTSLPTAEKPTEDIAVRKIAKPIVEETEENPRKDNKTETVTEIPKPPIYDEPQPDDVIFIGEAFNTYIIVQLLNDVYFIDKHAAHERIIFNKLKSEETAESQLLLVPITVHLDDNEYNAVISGIELLESVGFEIEDFGNGSVIIRAIPPMLSNDDVSAIITEAASTFMGGKINIERMDDIYHSIACKAAIKGGYITTKDELLSLAKRVLFDKEVMYCPHGRPVSFKLTKRELEKQFGRIQ